MEINAFSQQMARRGCVQSGNTFCGTYQGYPFTVKFVGGGSGGATRFSVWFMFQRQVMGARIFKPVRAAVKGKASAKAVYYADRRIAPFMLSVKNDADFDFVMDTFIAGMVDAARQNGLHPPENCPICGQGGCDSAACVSAAGQPVHAACVQGRAAGQQAKVRRNELTGSYALGTLGAVLGGFVGSIPTLLMYVFGNLVSGWLCALIPLCAYYGYKLLRGKMTRAVGPIVILVSLVMVPVFNYLGVAFLFMKEAGYFAAIDEYFFLFQLAGADMWRDLGISFLFTVFGIFIVSGVISRNNSHTWNEATGAAATLVPLNGQPLAQAPAAPVAAPATGPVAAPAAFASAPPAPAAEPAPKVPGELD